MESIVRRTPSGIAQRISGRAIVVSVAHVLALGMKNLAAAEAGDTRRARAHQPVEDIEVVADFVEEVGAPPFLLAPPVARQIAAMLGMQMLSGIHRNDI